MVDYDFPRNRVLAPQPTMAQQAMSNFCCLHPRCFNLSDMGTMKTLATLWAADFIMQQHKPGECRALVVCPLSILQRVWGDALANHFIGRRSFEIVHGTAEQRREILQRPADFYLINFDGICVGAKTKHRKLQLGGLAQDLHARADIRIAIIDEASAYRDRRTRRHRLARLLLQQRDYLWLLTATPNSNGPLDAYGLGLLVNNCYGETFAGYKNRTMIQLGQWKWVPARGGYVEAAKLLQPAIRFDIKDVWDGPGETVQARDVEITPLQRKMLADIKQKVMHIAGQNVQALPNEAVIRSKALQIAMGAIYDSNHKAWRTDSSSRIAELIDVVEEAVKKVVIFCPLTSVINLLHYELEQVGYKCIKLNGEVPINDRNKLVAAFQDDPAIRIAVCDPGVVAHGINEFVAATTAVWYGPVDKPEQYIQGNARVHRPGQTHPVTIVHLAATALERNVFGRLQSDQTMQGLMLDWVRKGDI